MNKIIRLNIDKRIHTSFLKRWLRKEDHNEDAHDKSRWHKRNEAEEARFNHYEKVVSFY